MVTRLFTVSSTTDGSGDATVYSPHLSGRLTKIAYTKDGTKPHADTVDMTITAEDSGESILTLTDVDASFTHYPRSVTHSATGAECLYSASGTGVLDIFRLANDRVKIVLAQGGDTTVGSFTIVVEA